MILAILTLTPTLMRNRFQDRHIVGLDSILSIDIMAKGRPHMYLALFRVYSGMIKAVKVRYKSMSS